jgi:hypothetical protein
MVNRATAHNEVLREWFSDAYTMLMYRVTTHLFEFHPKTGVDSSMWTEYARKRLREAVVNPFGLFLSNQSDILNLHNPSVLRSLTERMSLEDVVWAYFAKCVQTYSTNGLSLLYARLVLLKRRIESGDTTPPAQLLENLTRTTDVASENKRGFFKLIVHTGSFLLQFSTKTFSTKYKWTVDESGFETSFNFWFDYVETVARLVDFSAFRETLATTTTIPRSILSDQLVYSAERGRRPAQIHYVFFQSGSNVSSEYVDAERYGYHHLNIQLNGVNQEVFTTYNVLTLFDRQASISPLVSELRSRPQPLCLSVSMLSGLVLPLLSSFFIPLTGIKSVGGTLLLFETPTSIVSLNRTTDIVRELGSHSFQLRYTLPGQTSDPGRPLNYSHRVERSLNTLITPVALDPLLGVELEVSTDYTYRQMMKDWIVPKSDGSVSGSKRYLMELVTAPMAYSVQRRKWREFFKEHPSNGFCLNTNTNGLHIHLAQKSFLNNEHYSNFVRFFLNLENYSFLQIISHRRFFSGGPGQFTGVPVLLTQFWESEKALFEYLNNKYVPLGIKGETVECRLFNGYPTVGMLLLALDFMGALFVFSYERKFSPKAVTVKEFIEWLDTTQRSQYRALKVWWRDLSEGLKPLILNGLIRNSDYTEMDRTQWVFAPSGVMLARPPLNPPDLSFEKFEKIQPPKAVASCTLEDVPDGTIVRRNYFTRPIYFSKKDKSMIRPARAKWPISNQERFV